MKRKCLLGWMQKPELGWDIMEMKGGASSKW